MSVTTTSDEKVDQINQKLHEVKKVISENLKDIRVLTIEAFDNDTWGSGDWKEGTENKYHDVANDLQNIIIKLNKF